MLYTAGCWFFRLLESGSFRELLGKLLSTKAALTCAGVYAQSPYYTKNLPAEIAWLKLSGKFPMDMRIPPLNVKILLESNPLESRILVRRLAVSVFSVPRHTAWRSRSTRTRSARSRRRSRRRLPCPMVREYRSPGYRLRFSTEIYRNKRFSANTYRKLVLFLQGYIRRYSQTSGSLRENVIWESCTPVPSYTDEHVMIEDNQHIWAGNARSTRGQQRRASYA